MLGKNRNSKSVFDSANFYADECKLSVVPFARNDQSAPTKDRQKRPAIKEWASYQNRIADAEERSHWFSNDNKYGVGAVLGSVSGNLAVFDIEYPEVSESWEEKVRAAGLSDLLDKAVKVRSGGGGFHFYFRVEGESPSSRHLAFRLDSSGKRILTMELLGERHLVLLPGSPADCHPENNEYVLMHGDFENIPVIPNTVFNILVEVGRSLDEMPETLAVETRRNLPKKFRKIAEDFAEKAGWSDILTSHGITKVSEQQGEQFWRKPNSSDGGHHATTNYKCSDLFYCFSTDFAPFEAGRSYSKFEVFAELNHDGDFDPALAELKKQGYGKANSIQEELIEFAKSRLQLWKDANGNGFASIKVQGHVENYKLTDHKLRTILEDQFFKETGKIPHRELYQNMTRILEAEARLSSEHTPYIRLADHDGDIFLDLCDSEWRSVRVRRSGWDIVDNAPVKFLRRSGMWALPAPVDAVDINDFLALVNIHDPESQKLAIAWATGVINPAGPYPLLILTGLHGGGKSTTAKAFKKLFDPCRTLLRTMPGNDRDLFIAASNSFVLSFDNVSIIKSWLSDAFCRLSTGGGFCTRALYSDDAEVSFDRSCPIILNGIEDIVRRPDLLDRCIIIELPEIKESQRISEKEFWDRFDQCHAKTLGYLLTAVSRSLANADNVDLGSLPRMADFAIRVIAAEEFLGWEPGSFMIAYNRNRRDAVSVGLEEYAIVELIRKLVEAEDFEGTPSKLLEKLIGMTDNIYGLPKKPNILTGQLRRLAPSLKQIGIIVEFPPRGHERIVRISKSKK